MSSTSATFSVALLSLATLGGSHALQLGSTKALLVPRNHFASASLATHSRRCKSCMRTNYATTSEAEENSLQLQGTPRYILELLDVSGAAGLELIQQASGPLSSLESNTAIDEGVEATLSSLESNIVTEDGVEATTILDEIDLSLLDQLRMDNSIHVEKGSKMPAKNIMVIDDRNQENKVEEGANHASCSLTKPDPQDMSTKSMIKEIAALGLPALGGCLVDPVMSLVDTACVGQVSSLQLASLAPCTSICQFLFFSFFFLCTATTTFVAANPPDAPGLEPSEVSRRLIFNEQIVSSASGLAVGLGLVIAGILLTFPDQLLLLAGCAKGEMMSLGKSYLRIRALGLPSVFLLMVLQGASLGRQDAWTPLKIFAVAGIANLVGDMFLTLRCGWGVKGAAIATVASQGLAAAYYLYRVIRIRSPTHQTTKSSEDGSAGFSSISTSTPTISEDVAAAASSKGVALVWRGLPSMGTVKSFMAVALTLMFRSVINMTSYTSLTRTTAGMGTTALAAHLVTLQVFWMMSFVPEPVGMAAQSLIARDVKDRPWRVSKFLRVSYGLSTAAGCLMALLTGVALTTPMISKAIVADPSVRALLLVTAPFAMTAQLFCSLSCISDSACLGLRDIKHLPLSTTAATMALAAGLLSVIRRGMGVEGVWMCLNIFFAVRSVGHIALSRRLKGLLFNFRGKKAVEHQVLTSAI